MEIKRTGVNTLVTIVVQNCPQLCYVPKAFWPYFKKKSLVKNPTTSRRADGQSVNVAKFKLTPECGIYSSNLFSPPHKIFIENFNSGRAKFHYVCNPLKKHSGHNGYKHTSMSKNDV